MTKDEALQLAFEELEDVQFIDNTWQEASVSRAEAKEILRKLADRLTMLAPDKGQAAVVKDESGSAPCG